MCVYILFEARPADIISFVFLFVCVDTHIFPVEHIEFHEYIHGLFGSTLCVVFHLLIWAASRVHGQKVA